MCCGSKVCCCCMCLILVVVGIGLLFGFGVFKNGFQKLHDAVHYDHLRPVNGSAATFRGRPFVGFNAPPPF